MFKLVSELHKNEITDLVDRMAADADADYSGDLLKLTEVIRDDIPERKRISYGRYSIIKETGLFIYPLLKTNKIDPNRLAERLYNNKNADPFIRSLGIQLMSVDAENTGNLETALDYFEKAASDDSWIVRECSSGFVRKLIRGYSETMKKWYLEMVSSEDTFRRRFAGESLRPVADNRWFKKQPEFAWNVLECLFHEPAVYPRTSAGNSLSDWMRIDPDRTLPVVKELAANGDKNSYWIAYRACRNLVKKEPLMVMDILKTDHYKYKDRDYHRADYE